MPRTFRSGRLPLTRGLVRTLDHDLRWHLQLPLKNSFVSKALYQARTGHDASGNRGSGFDLRYAPHRAGERGRGAANNSRTSPRRLPSRVGGRSRLRGGRRSRQHGAVGLLGQALGVLFPERLGNPPAKR